MESSKLVYDAEVKKLKEYGFNDLKVELVTKTHKEEITKAGAGYDIKSYNEKKEKIFIEVKCSLTNAKGFHLSKKEFQFVCKELEQLNSNLCYIYFVYNEHTKGDCFILDKEKILQSEIEPTQILCKVLKFIV